MNAKLSDINVAEGFNDFQTACFPRPNGNLVTFEMLKHRVYYFKTETA